MLHATARFWFTIAPQYNSYTVFMWSCTITARLIRMRLAWFPPHVCRLAFGSKSHCSHKLEHISPILSRLDSRPLSKPFCLPVNTWMVLLHPVCATCFRLMYFISLCWSAALCCPRNWSETHRGSGFCVCGSHGSGRFYTSDGHLHILI